MYFSTSSFYCCNQKYELTASLAIPLSAVVTVTAGWDCVNFLSWLQRCRGNPEINICCFGVLSAMSLLTPPPLLVKSGQWKLFLASVCQTSLQDYLRSSRLCLEKRLFSRKHWSLLSAEASLWCSEDPHSSLQTKHRYLLVLLANLLLRGKLYLKIILTDMFSFGRFI